MFTEAMGGSAGAGAPGEKGLTPEDVNSAIAMVETRARMREALAACSLPQAAKDKLRQNFDGRERFAEADVAQAITAEGEYLSRFAEAGAVRGLGTGRIEVGAGLRDRVPDMLDAFFDPAHKDHRSVQSFKECYVTMTGDGRVTGRFRECDQTRLREALATDSLADVLGDAITRRLLAEYRQSNVVDAWRNIVNVVPVSDFRTQERTRIGGYGDLPAVAESADYAALVSPGDEKASYAVTKRGGLESVTLEMIKNDDAGAVRRIPVKLARAAKRTLSKFVFDFIAANPVIYDGVAFFHADHDNLGAAALAEASYEAARLALWNQTPFGETEPLAVPVKYLLVPAVLEKTAFDLFSRDTNLDKTFIQSLAPTILPVWSWTDPNDWAVMADPADIPGIEIGFLDGSEEPELFVQDGPTVGSMFASDKVTYKIRHIYGGNVTDHRAAYKGVAA
jgi:hypothetical protein